MKKFYLVLFCVMVTIGSSFAQKSTIEVGTPYRVIDAVYKNYFYLDNQMISVKAGRGKITLQLFDVTNMTEIKRNQTKLKYEQTIEYVCLLGNDLYLFYSYWDRPNRKEQLFAQKINTQTCSFDGAPVKLIACDKIRQVIYDREKEGKGVKFTFSHSFDKSKLLVQYRLIPEIKNDSKNYDIIGLYVFGANLKQLSGEQFIMPYTEKQMDNLDYSLDSEGNVYLLVAVTVDKGDKFKNIGLLKIPFGEKSIQETELKLVNNDNKDIDKRILVESANLFESKDSSMLCAGLYTYEKSKGTEGIFLMNCDELEVSAKLYEIPLSVMNQYEKGWKQNMNERADDKGKADIRNLVLRDVVVNPDGSTIINAEQYYLKRSAVASSSSTTYAYNFIIATKVNKDGTVAWIKKIPKQQVTGSGVIGVSMSTGMDVLLSSIIDNKSGLSFRYFKVGENNYYIFLDNVKNENLPLNRYPAKHVDGQGGFLTAYIVNDITGEMKRSTLLDTRKVNGKMPVFQFNVNRVFKLSENTFGIETYKKKKEDVLIKIKVE